jgi:hypothetical protein
MRFFDKKGQAALEFLTTYGWAFLIILVMVGALAYFGVLSPERFIPERCKLTGEIECNTFQLSTNSIRLNLQNNLADAIVIISLKLTDPKTGNTELLPIMGINRTVNAFNSVDLADDGSDGNFSTFSTMTLTAGEKLKFNMELKWYKSSAGPNFIRTTTGDIVATVSP